MNKTAILVIAIVLVVAGLIVWYAPKKAVGPSTPTTEQNITPLVGEPAPTNPQSAPETKTFTVNYDAKGFTPNSIEIKVGDTVDFKNIGGILKKIPPESAEKMWVASNPHPSHTDYPEFDAKKNYKNDETYSFTFTKAGTWGYHNHLDPGKTGIVIVK